MTYVVILLLASLSEPAHYSGWSAVLFYIIIAVKILDSVDVRMGGMRH